MRQQDGGSQGRAFQLLHASVRVIEEYSEAADRVAAPPTLNGTRTTTGAVANNNLLFNKYEMLEGA
jgi:hypothetical protein